MIFSTFSERRHLLLLLLFVLLLGACSNSPRSTETYIENPESQSLKLIIKTKDLPGKWSWDKVFVHQPSQAQSLTQTDIVDSASTTLIGDYLLEGKWHYIWIIHKVTQYASESPRVEPSSLHSAFEDESQESKAPDLQNFGDRMVAKCFDTDPLLDCTIIVSYPSIESRLTIIMPKGLDISELENLINTILTVNDNKIVTILKQ